MTLTVRSSLIALTTIVATTLGVAACSDSNNPPATATGEGGATIGTGGSAAIGTGGSAAIGTGGSDTTGRGGSDTTGTAGSTATGVGGATTGTAGSTTTASQGGAMAAGGAVAASGAGTFSPLCTGLTTVAGPAPTKGGQCAATDPQLCYKTCGPKSVGFKSETCTAAAYAEGACVFDPSLDYTCFKIPATLPDATTCGLTTTAPQAGQACTAAECTLCSLNGSYLDSSANPKTGFCVCQAASGTPPTRTWSCASATAWPCPGNTGC
jgi:hypothetical protein